MPSNGIDSISVVSNVSPKHYGICAWTTEYNLEGLDAGREKVWSEHTGKWRIQRMFWHIEKGDDLVRARPIELDFFRSFSPNPTRAQLQTTEHLLQSDRDNAPRHQRPDMTTNCVLQADLTVLPEEFFDKKSRTDANGKTVEYWDLWYKLVVTISSGPMQFSLKCRGKEYSSVEISY